MSDLPLTPIFSVITVTYNAEKVLERTLQSVVAQTYPHVEYIIVDGGSTDKTPAIIGKYRSQIHAVVSEPDRGLYDAMNKGIRMATGHYLCFLNAGDCFREVTTLQQAVLSLHGRELPDVIYGDTAIVDSERRFLRMRHLTAPDSLDFKSFRRGMLVCHQAFWVRRELAVPYDRQYRFSADFDWCVRILRQARSTHHTRLILIDYLDEGLTTNNRKASLKERFLIMAKHYGLTGTVVRHIGFVFRAMFRRR